MAISKVLSDIYVPTFEMRVDEKPLSLDDAKTILEISVTEVANQASSFSFRLNDPALRFIEPKSGLFTEGRRVAISIGYVGKTRTMIVGEINTLTADFPSSGPATLHVDGFDLLHKATRGTTYRQFEDGKLDSDIVTEIARDDMKLTPSVDATKQRTGRRVQNNITNLKFLEALAKANGYFLWVDDTTLYFKKERPGSAIQLEWGKTLLSFSPRFSTAGQVNVVKVQGWDPMQKQSISGRMQISNANMTALAKSGQQQLSQGAGGRSERVVLCDASISSPEEAQIFAEGIMSEQQRNLITGNGTCVGNPDIRMGMVLDLRRIGRFSRHYVVEQVTHTVGDSGYQTSFQVRQRL